MNSKAINRCRLCPSQINLISMFHGKSRNVRDDLRKIIWDTIGIKIEPSDSLPTVCLNCLVDVTNFYYFKISCFETQNHLEDNLNESYHRKKLKHSVKCLEQIQTPSKEKINEIFHWLDSKGLEEVPAKTFEDKSLQTLESFTQSEPLADLQTSLKQTNKFSEQKNSKIKTKDKSSQVLFDICDAFTQCELLQTESISSQTNKSSFDKLKKLNTKKTQTFFKTCEAFTQCNVRETNSEYSQTDSNTKLNSSQKDKFSFNKNTNCNLKVHTFVESYLPDKIKTKNIYSQTSFKNCEAFTQCDILENISDCIKSKTRNKLSIQDIRLTRNVYSQIQSNLSFEPYLFNEGLLNKFHSNDKSDKKSQTYSGSDSEIRKLLVKNKFDQSSQTDPPLKTSVSIQCDLINIFNSKEVNSKVKLHFKEEKLSPVEALSISISPEKVETVSPSYDNLLQVNKKKSLPVQICKLCDKSLYTKRQVTWHNKFHMRCKFCKISFKTWENTEAHAIECKLKTLPTVHLERCD